MIAPKPGWFRMVFSSVDSIGLQNGTLFFYIKIYNFYFKHLNVLVMH